MKKPSPKFIGIGAKGAGLSLLTKLLEAHPQVEGPVESSSFFSSGDYEKKGLAHYEKLMAFSTTKPRSGECCVEYLTTDGVADKITQHYPDAKIIAIVRNPINRAILEYNHAKTTGVIKKSTSCAQYLTNRPTAQTDGFYGMHLGRYFSYYTSLQLQVIVYEDFAREPLKVMQSLYDFLELNKEFVPKRLQAFAPPPDEPKHRGRISRLIRFVIKSIKKIRPKKELGPLVQLDPVHLDYFSDAELTLFKKTFAADSSQLSNLLHRDMVAYWELDTNFSENKS